MSANFAELPRLIVCLSGSGTNFQALLEAIAAKELRAQIVLVVSNRQAAFGLRRAEQAAIPTLYFPLAPYSKTGLGREAYERDLAERLASYQPNLIVLAGWMHIFGPAFLAAFPNQIINLHPALPSTFPGTQAIQAAFASFQRGEITQSGCMVHYVVSEIDAGPVLVQANVPFEPNDTLETFETRMHQAEHQIIVEAVRRFLATND